MTNFSDANATYSNFNYANFDTALLFRTNFTFAKMHKTTFTDCNLDNAECAGLTKTDEALQKAEDWTPPKSILRTLL